MKKTDFWKGFGLGFTVLLLILGLCMTVFAAYQKTINVDEGVGISINGAAFVPRDVNGEPVEVFAYRGTTYAPVRALCEAAGLDVEYDPESETVRLTTQDRLRTQNGTADTYISADRAKEIALADAGIAQDAAIFLKANFERDDGRYQYDVEFYSGQIEYGYEIDAVTGKILSTERDLDDFIVPTTPATPSSAPADGTISADRAKEIALADAGIKANSAVFQTVKLDWDDGRWEYDVEFVAGAMEYEYEINAETGAIIARDMERPD